MSDWVIDSDNQLSQKGASQPASQQQSDWVIDNGNNSRSLPIQPQEGIGTSLWKAPFRVTEDVAHGVMGGLQSLSQNLPSYYEAAKTEIPGMASTIWNHPGHAAMQTLAGGLEAVNSLDKIPSSVMQYGANRLNLIPQSWANAVASTAPQDSTNAISQLFGQPQYPGEALLRGVVRNAPNIYAAGEALSALKLPGLLATKNSLVKDILNPHDALEARAGEGFKTVSDEVNKRGIDQVPINPYAIDDLSEFFPKTSQAKALLDKAKTGDYNALRKVQSQLYQSAKDHASSPLPTDKLRANEIFEKRNDINQAISDHLVEQGHNDLNDILNKARSDYKTLQDVYYHDQTPNALSEMANQDIRKIPKNLPNILQENSKQMKIFLDHHPGLQNDLNKYLFKQNALNFAKRYGIPVGLGVYAIDKGMNYMRSNDNQ